MRAVNVLVIFRSCLFCPSPDAPTVTWSDEFMYSRCIREQRGEISGAERGERSA